jgi:RNA polymerase sigma factor (sigma-70 family)
MRAELALDSEPVGLGGVGELYAQRRAQVWRLVRHGVRAPDPVIDEACEVAWARLLDHRGRVARASAIAWLVTTGRHEALRLVRRSERELSLEQLQERAGDLGGQADHAPAADVLAAARARLDSVGHLPERQQRIVWLHAFGLTYAEIAQATGESRRSVERQILRAKGELGREPES